MSFWHVKTVDVDRQTKYTYDFMKGTQDLHCVTYVNIHDVNKMLKKDLSFFCSCLDSKYKDFMYLAWTKAWQVKVQNTNNSRYVRNVNQTTTHEDEWD